MQFGDICKNECVDCFTITCCFITGRLIVILPSDLSNSVLVSRCSCSRRLSSGWVNTLVGGQKEGARGFMFFIINVDLTEEGLCKDLECLCICVCVC